MRKMGIKYFIFTTFTFFYLLFFSNSNICFATDTSSIATISPDVYDEEISLWHDNVVYEPGDFVLYNNNIFYASNTNLNSIPTENNYWSYKGTLTSSVSKNPLNLYNTSSKSRITTKVIEYNAALSSSLYQYTIRSFYPSPWTAFVNSVIVYDHGEHTVIHNDFYSNITVGINASQGRKYFYNNITRVIVVLSGTLNGKPLVSSGGTFYP